MAKKKNKATENLVSEIGAIIGSLKTMADTAMNGSIPEVKHILKNKIRNDDLIERQLDNMMNLSLAGADDTYFFKLLDYYQTINKKGADFYRKFYKDLI